MSCMGWLRSVGSLKLQVSFAKEPYKRDDILQRRPIILRSLLTVATPYQLRVIPKTGKRAQKIDGSSDLKGGFSDFQKKSHICACKVHASANNFETPKKSEREWKCLTFCVRILSWGFLYSLFTSYCCGCWYISRRRWLDTTFYKSGYIFL